MAEAETNPHAAHPVRPQLAWMGTLLQNWRTSPVILSHWGLKWFVELCGCQSVAGRCSPKVVGKVTWFKLSHHHPHSAIRLLHWVDFFNSYLALGLHCYVWALEKDAVSRGEDMQASELWCSGLASPWHVGSSQPAIKSVSPTLQGGFLTTGPPGKSHIREF